MMISYNVLSPEEGLSGKMAGSFQCWNKVTENMDDCSWLEKNLTIDFSSNTKRFEKCSKKLLRQTDKHE